MRRGDCCLLKIDAINLEDRFITVKTMKTGTPVAIPIFPLLYDELQQWSVEDKGFVFPEPAAMYQQNPSGINWRLKQFFKKIGLAEYRDRAQSMCTDETHASDSKPAGLIRENVRGFHCFRTTWVTLALTAGVPLEIVQKIIGDKTVDVVLTNYFQPHKETYRDTLMTAMPTLLTNGAPSRDEQMRNILAQMTETSWEQDKASLLALLA